MCAHVGVHLLYCSYDILNEMLPYCKCISYFFCDVAL